MATEIIPWVSEDYLKTPEDVARYLNAALEDGDARVLAHALGVVARSKGFAALAVMEVRTMTEYPAIQNPDRCPSHPGELLRDDVLPATGK